MTEKRIVELIEKMIDERTTGSVLYSPERHRKEGAITALYELRSAIESHAEKMEKISEYLIGKACKGNNKIMGVEYNDQDEIYVICGNFGFKLYPDTITEFLEAPYKNIASIYGRYTVLAQVGYSPTYGVVCACYDDHAKEVVFKLLSDIMDHENK